MGDELWIKIIAGLISAIYGLFMLYLNSKFTAMDKRVEKLEKHQEDMQINYIKRFEEVTKLLHKIDLNVVKIDGKVDKQKELCETIQRAKKLNEG